MSGLLAIILAGAAEAFRRLSWRRLRQSERLGRWAAWCGQKSTSFDKPGDRS